MSMRLWSWLFGRDETETTNGKQAPTMGVPVELDRTRHLRYTLQSMRDMRQEFGKELDTGVTDDKIGKMLWYGLRHEDAKLTPEMVEEMVDLKNLEQVLNSMAKALGHKGEVHRNPPKPLPVAAENKEPEK